MFQGSAQTRPWSVAAATVLGKYGASSPGWRPGVRSSSHPARANSGTQMTRSEEHTSELQSRLHIVCRLLLEKKNESSLFSQASADVFINHSLIQAFCAS